MFHLSRQLYWSDWSADAPGIKLVHIDTLERTTLVSGDIEWPNGLAVNFKGSQHVNQANMTCVDFLTLNIVLRDLDLHFLTSNFEM